MKLSIVDMRAVLKERTQGVTGRKASDDPVDIMAGVKDIQSVIDEMKKYALEQISTKEELKNEQKTNQ